MTVPAKMEVYVETLCFLATKRRITSNLKTINNQSCQNINLHGTPTNKDLEKDASRLVGRVEMGRQDAKQAEGTRGKVEDHTGEEGLAHWETKDSKPLPVNTVGLRRWEKLPVSQESSLESRATAKQTIGIVPSLNPPPQTVPQGSKKGCPTLLNT